MFFSMRRNASSTTSSISDSAERSAGFNSGRTLSMRKSRPASTLSEPAHSRAILATRVVGSSCSRERRNRKAIIPAATAVARMVPAARPLRSSHGLAPPYAPPERPSSTMVSLSLLRLKRPSGALSGALSGATVETVLRQLFFECRNIYAKQLGRRVPVAVGTQERTLDIARFSRGDNVRKRLAVGQLLVQINDRNFPIDLHRQVLGGDDSTPSKDDRTLHGVLELAHIAWPVVRQEPLQRLLAHPGRGAGVGEAMLLQEVLDQQRNIVFALAQRRNVDGDDRQAVVQV